MCVMFLCILYTCVYMYVSKDVPDLSMYEHVFVCGCVTERESSVVYISLYSGDFFFLT